MRLLSWILSFLRRPDPQVETIPWEMVPYDFKVDWFAPVDEQPLKDINANHGQHHRQEK
jgi:hypothetical protein